MLDLSEAVRMQNSMSTVKIKVIMLLPSSPLSLAAASLSRAHIIKWLKMSLVITNHAERARFCLKLNLTGGTTVDWGHFTNGLTR